MIGSAMLITAGAFAQRTCGTKQPGPEFEAWMQKGIEKLQNSPRQQVIYTIPVIVHVIHNGENVGVGTNLSTAQIQSQIDVLNEDYRKLNADISNIPNATFSGVAADVEINFCMATKDPNGNTLTTPGINRINRTTAGFTAPPFTDTYMDATIKPATIWDVNKYLNIWVANLSGGLLGYATFPAGSGLTGLSAPYGSTTSDGVVILYNSFGRTGNVAAPYNKGRTATHEIGHWLGLRHIWGDSNCGTDYVTDTPTQQSSNFGCPTYPSTTCSNGANGDMFMNYMDYTDDACMYMFTAGQKQRMQQAMANGTYRKNYNSAVQCASTPAVALDAGVSSVVSPTGASCNASVTPQVVITNYGTTTLTAANVLYKIDNGTPVTYAWTGSLAQNATATVTLPAFTGTNGTHSFKAYTTSPNGGADGSAANDTSSSTFTINITGQALPYSEGFEATTFPPTGTTITNPDNMTTWERTTAAKKTGVASMLINHYDYAGGSGQKDDLTLPMINLSGSTNPALTFQVAYKMYTNPASSPNYSDTLEVLASTDCGATWTSVYKKFGTALATATPAYTTASFVPTSTMWRMETVSLNPFNSSTGVLVKLRSISDYENNLYVDDINISGSVGIRAMSDDNSVMVYPNPANDQLNISLGLNGQEVTVKMMNTLGEVVWNSSKSNANLFTVDLSSVADGVYLIEVSNGVQKFHKKVVVNH